eukprot:GILI01011916.1.p1 GENE.GILI01011916.1~~GILI01011916.1.p1  ORF type:complete len:307 (+),score=84.03 GILI01011916.1:69-989(+)
MALSSAAIASGLSHVSKTVDGTGYALVKLDISGKEIESLGEELEKYQHLRHINLSKNKVQDATALTKLPHLLTINAESNAISSLEPFTQDVLGFLQQLNLSENKITSLPAIKLPLLVSLNLSTNEIASCASFEGHSSLVLLKLGKNKLTSAEGLKDMPNLRKLILPENELESAKGLSNLTSLRSIDLRSNKLTSLDGLDACPLVDHVNIRENQIASLDEIKKLKSLPKLDKLKVSGNPIVDELGGEYRKEILMILPNLKNIDKDEVTADERTEAAEELQRRAEEEAAKAAEAAAAAAAAEGEEGAE